MGAENPVKGPCMRFSYVRIPNGHTWESETFCDFLQGLTVSGQLFELGAKLGKLPSKIRQCLRVEWKRFFDLLKFRSKILDLTVQRKATLEVRFLQLAQHLRCIGQLIAMVN